MDGRSSISVAPRRRVAYVRRKFKECRRRIVERSKSNKDKMTTWKESAQGTVTVTEELTNIRQLNDNLQHLIQQLMKTCSSFAKVRKTLAYVLRFINNAGKKESNTSTISPEELGEYELQMFKWCQETSNINNVDQKLMS